MKWKSVLFSVLTATLFVGPLQADTLALPADSLMVPVRQVSSSEPELTAYERRLARRMERWMKLAPSHFKLQFAGSIGMFSAGLGWTYGRTDQWETDLQLGFIPKFNSDEVRIILTTRQSYLPWLVPLGKSDFSLRPLTCGMFVSTVLSNDFWVSEPQRYPSGYYGFSTRLRLNLFVGQRITYHIPRHKRNKMMSLSAYYELSACDVDLLTFFGNRSIPLIDVLSLAVGLKLHL